MIFMIGDHTGVRRPMSITEALGVDRVTLLRRSHDARREAENTYGEFVRAAAKLITGKNNREDARALADRVVAGTADPRSLRTETLQHLAQELSVIADEAGLLKLLCSLVGWSDWSVEVMRMATGDRQDPRVPVRRLDDVHDGQLLEVTRYALGNQDTGYRVYAWNRRARVDPTNQVRLPAGCRRQDVEQAVVTVATDSSWGTTPRLVDEPPSVRRAATVEGTVDIWVASRHVIRRPEDAGYAMYRADSTHKPRLETRVALPDDSDATTLREAMRLTWGL